ncbi:GspH/FimT family pseudopilin [Piscinibacter sp.]|uniref:GspH/FimT family pseudopilin n=1 Tax=Piscinibacter sp. TaxID=1903157 RepID=UPI002BA7ACDF|nr:GspH/FimT family pseudopilin [Albitalea sp.]HUG23253.1 GspH/FimT family pseudopilin [Albitalea sp.]
MTHGGSRGFTLIEALTTVAVLVVLASLAAPGLQNFVTRNKVASISNEFSSALQQTRALAISKNTCASFCASKTVKGDGNESCDADSDNFQAGWIIFENPTCSAAQADPEANGAQVSSLRRGDDTAYKIAPSDEALTIVMFDPRGFANLAAAGHFEVIPPSEDESLKRVICIDAAGRATVRKWKSEDACS